MGISMIPRTMTMPPALIVGKNVLAPHHRQRHQKHHSRDVADQLGFDHPVGQAQVVGDGIHDRQHQRSGQGGNDADDDPAIGTPVGFGVFCRCLRCVGHGFPFALVTERIADWGG